MTWPDLSFEKCPMPHDLDTGKPIPTVMVLAGEPSGDLHAGNLIREMKRICPHLNVVGMGGPAMKQAGAAAVPCAVINQTC